MNDLRMLIVFLIHMLNCVFPPDLQPSSKTSKKSTSASTDDLIKDEPECSQKETKSRAKPPANEKLESTVQSGTVRKNYLIVVQSPILVLRNQLARVFFFA